MERSPALAAAARSVPDARLSARKIFLFLCPGGKGFPAGIFPRQEWSARRNREWQGNQPKHQAISRRLLPFFKGCSKIKTWKT